MKKQISVIEKAAHIALVAHAGQKRKDDDSPYILHPFMVAIKLAKYNFPESVIAGALVHDVLEDTKVTEEELRQELGDEVVSLVVFLTEEGTLPWEERKQKYIDTIRVAPEGAKAISIADKIHSAESILAAHKVQGKDVWKHFNRGKDAKVWFEKGLLSMFKSSWSHPLIEEYEVLVEKIEKLEA